MEQTRWQLVQRVLQRRQPDLTVLMDGVHKPHNFSAVVRTCDAVGIYETHIIPAAPGLSVVPRQSQGSDKWVKVHWHTQLSSALAALKASGHTLVAAHASTRSRDFREFDYTQPTALIIGTELHGLSDEALVAAETHISVPMMGMVASLNVSVAAAIILYEAQRQRGEAGMYDRSRLEGSQYKQDLFKWAQPAVAEYCDQHNLDYPALTDEGDVVGNLPGTSGCPFSD